MSCCNIVDGSFFDDISDINNFTIDISRLQALLPSGYTDSQKTNIWFPIFITPSDISSSFDDFIQSNLLIQAERSVVSDPCNCKPTNSIYSGQIQNNIINCNYCFRDDDNDTSSNWALLDENGSTSYGIYSSTCETSPVVHKDIRANDDDILPKIPVLNNSYITKALDFKYQNRYPATQNTIDQSNNRYALGFEQFAKYSESETKSFKLNSNPVCVDWSICPRMGEIPFDDTDTYHKDVDTHIKSYNRFLHTNKTCGNFIFLEPSVKSDNALDFYGLLSNSGDRNKLNLNKKDIPYFTGYPSAFNYLPTDEQFTIPYGLSKPFINNVFINKQKELSHWIWKYDKAVLCWYRYSPASNANNDKRPIPGVDLYISNGDVFWASIKSLEGSNLSTEVGCPSGIKVTNDNNVIKYVIPDNSKFIYISKNIYPQFLKILNRLEKYTAGFTQQFTPIERINIAAIQATGPAFDEITLDTFKTQSLYFLPSMSRPKNILDDGGPNTFYRTNLSNFIENNIGANNFTRSTLNEYENFGQNSSAIKEMLSKNDNNMSHLLGIPSFHHKPSVSKINYVDSKESLIRTLSYKYGSYLLCAKNRIMQIELKTKQKPNVSIEMDFELFTNFVASTGSTKDNPVIGYDQEFIFNDISINTSLDYDKQFSASCLSGVYKDIKYADAFGSFIFNNQTISRQPVSTGQTILQDRYYRGSYDLAVEIEGEELCYEKGLCDDNLYNKYAFRLSEDIQPIKFKNNDINLVRKYSASIYNPNIDSLAISNGIGIYYASNFYGTGVRFIKNGTNIETSGSVILKFNTKKCSVKLYQINIEKIRSPENLSCKTMPIQDRCKCYPMQNYDYPFYSAASKASVHSNSTLWTPDISTTNVRIKKYGARPSSDPVFTYSNKPPQVQSSDIPPLDRYYDPEYKGCVSNHLIELPIYTRTNWKLTAYNFNLDNHRLWSRVIDSTSLFGEHNKIQVNINSIPIFDNQERALTSTYPAQNISQLNIELLNNKYIGAMAKSPSPILYQPLRCSTEGSQIHNVQIDFKYLPDKHLIFFQQSPIVAMGELNPVSYTPESGLIGGNGTNSKITFDSKTNLFSFSDRGISSKRFVGSINQRLLSVLDSVKNLDNKKINLHIQTWDGWKTVKLNTFGYYQNKSAYLGYPFFHEYISSSKNKKLLGFLSSFKLMDPKFSYEYKYTDKEYVYANELLSNFVNLDGIRGYFRIPSIKEIYNEYDQNASSENKTTLIDDLYHAILTNNLFLDYNIDSDRSSLDTLIAREDCFVPVKFYASPTSTPIESTILTKYIFRSKTDNRLYASLRLLPTYKSGGDKKTFDASILNGMYIDWNKTDIIRLVANTPINDSKITSFTITRNIPNIIGESDSILQKHKWADIYGFDSYFRSFDISNRLDYLIGRPPFLTYDNVLYDLYLYNFIYYTCYNKIPTILVDDGINLNNLVRHPNSDVKLLSFLSYFYSDYNDESVREEKDYLYPFMDLNYIHNQKTTPWPFYKGSGIVSYTGNIYFSGIKTIKEEVRSTTPLLTNNEYNPNYNNGYFWVDIPNSQVLYQREDSVAQSTTFKVQQPKYILQKNDISIGENIIDNLSSIRSISPTITLYRDSYRNNFRDKKYISEKYINYPVYFHQNQTIDCNNNCNIGKLRDDSLYATYLVDTEAYSDGIILGQSVNYAISVGDGSYHNYPYIYRKILAPNSHNYLFPGKNSQNQTINNNNAIFLEDDIKNVIYGERFVGVSTNNLTIDTVANEMLYRLYYGSLQHINTDTVGKRSLQTFLKKKKLLSLKYLIENNNDVSINDVYDLIPYEYDNNAKVENVLKFNGNISIYGKYRPGDTIQVQIGSQTYPIAVEENANSIDLVINNNFRSTLLTKKTITSGLVTTQPSNPPINTEDTKFTKIGSCNTYNPTTWSAFSYIQEYTPDGVSLYDRYLKCRKVSKHFEIVNGYSPRRLGDAIGLYTDTFGGDPSEIGAFIAPVISFGFIFPIILCGGCPCLMEYCDSHSIFPEGPFPEGTIIAAQSTHRVAPGGRVTYSPGACLGPNNGPCSPTPGGGSNAPSPSFRTGDSDQLAGGYSPRDPIPIPMSCSYSGCGPQCLDINYSDKFGNQIYLNKFRPAGFGGTSAPPPMPCQCVPYDIVNCEKPIDPKCYSCTNREQKQFLYNFEYGDYNFNAIPASISRDTTSSVPGLAPQSNIRFPDFSDCNDLGWDPIAVNGDRNATEVCGYTESPSSNTVYNIYQSVTTTISSPELPSCPVLLVSIEFDNNQIIFNTPNGQKLCITTSTKQSCPTMSLQMPAENRYYFTNSIDSECSECGNKPKNLFITYNEQTIWETIIEDRIAILGMEAIDGDLNYTSAGGGAGYTGHEACGPIKPICCYDQCEHMYAGSRQCGKSAPDSWPWRYCLECNIPGSSPPELKQQVGGTSLLTNIYGGIVTNCLGFSFNGMSSPQIKAKYIAEWKKVMKLRYLDVAPCHNNQNLNVENLIEGVIPGSCSLEFTTISYPGLAYRRTREGAESQSFTLGVQVAYIKYQYKRPKTIQDVLLDEELCNDYNNGNNYAGSMREIPNMVEKIVNGGLCGKEIICTDEVKAKCDTDNLCCKQNIGHA